MIKVQFFARNASTADPNDSLSIHCQLALDNEKQATPFSLRISVPLMYWQSNRYGNWVKDDYFRAETINSYLKSTVCAFEDIIAYLRMTEEEISYKNLRKYFDTSTFSMITPSKSVKSYPRLLDVFDEMVEITGQKRKWAKNTYKTYESRRVNLVTFLKAKGLETIRVNEVRYKFFESFDVWLMTKGDVCRNYANKILGSVKKALAYAVNADYLENMPIGNLNLEYDAPKPPNYLLPLERVKIKQYQGSMYKRVRDIAVFLMYTGFSYVDYLELSEQHLLEEDGWKKIRHKSKVFALPPLMDPARELIKEYQGVDNLPKMDLTDFNKKLKHFGNYIGVTIETVGFNLTSSVFRDTFCSMMENELYIDHRTLMAMMGHTNPKQLRNYSSLMPRRILHELKKQNIVL